MKSLKIDSRYFPLLVTIILFFAMFAVGSLKYEGFFSIQVLMNLLIDNCFLIITAVGMTFVIISGGIDLSVGAMIALTTMITANLIQVHHMPPAVVIPLALIIGSVFGTIMGLIIHHFNIQPFIVTLAGMFFARGLSYVISVETITIDNEWFTQVSQAKIHLFGDSFISINVVIALLVLAAGMFLAHFTSFGRSVYAIGGSEQSAILMGLPVARTKVLVYTISGFCSSLAGVVFSIYMLSGYGSHAFGLELDAIASVVIGGTLLTGGVGYVLGTLFGVLIQGIIQTIITFEGTLSSWWTKIAIGMLLLLFILMQRLLVSRKRAGQANQS